MNSPPIKPKKRGKHPTEDPRWMKFLFFKNNFFTQNCTLNFFWDLNIFRIFLQHRLPPSPRVGLGNILRTKFFSDKFFSNIYLKKKNSNMFFFVHVFSKHVFFRTSFFFKWFFLKTFFNSFLTRRKGSATTFSLVLKF